MFVVMLCICHEVVISVSYYRSLNWVNVNGDIKISLSLLLSNKNITYLTV